MRPGILVLVSGGLDSAVLLRWAISKGPVAALTFERADRPRGERLAARRLLDHYRVDARYVAAYPAPVPGWVQGARSRAWIPGRNLFQLAAAAMLARRLRARSIAVGHSADDAQSFLDAGRAFLDDAERLINADGGRRLVVLSPFARLRKAEIALMGRTWGVPLETTWSCYRDGPRPCGRCRACWERNGALAAAPAPCVPSARRRA